MQKRMKRLIAGLLVVVILSSVTLFTACENNENREHLIEYTAPGVTEPSDTPNTSGEITSGTCGDNLTWVLYRDGELVISGTGEMYNYHNDSDVPWYFRVNDIKTVTIKQGATSIGDWAFFGCTSLTNITIPDSVKSIGNGAFENYTSLKSITVNENNQYYSNDEYGVLFNKDKTELIQYPAGNESTTYDIPDSVTTIGDSAFKNCISLESVIIPDSVTSIGEYAFYYCTSLENITVDENNQYYSSDEYGVLFNKDKTELIQYPIGNERISYKIPASVGTFEEYVPFFYCTSLTSITVDENNQYYSSDEYGVLFNKDKTELIQYPIGNERASYDIPDSVTSIEYYAFAFCTSLISVTIPDSVTSIEYYAFDFCTSLTSVTIPDSVTSIEYYAFRGCTSLTSITIPDSVTFIGRLAFPGCTSLISLTVDENNQNYSTDEYGVLFNKDKTDLIQYPLGNERTSYNIPDSVTTICDWTFLDCTSLASITIPDSVTSIGVNAFYNTAYYNDESNWENGILYINNHLIKANTDITEKNEIRNGTKCIAGGAFFRCESLTSVTIPDSVTSIGREAFSNCTSLTSITIPDSITSIGDSAFSGCTSLKSVTIPDSITSIGDDAFRGCTSITSITIPDGVTSIGNDAFRDCTSITSITIPDSVTSIRYQAFYRCTSLTTVTIGNSVTSIGREAFSGCTSLTSVYYTGTKEQWNSISNYGDNNCLTSANIIYSSP